MKIRAAIMRKVPGEWEVADVDMDEPRQNEVVIKMIASGLCHSDDHIATGDLPVGLLPMAGGHEGAGIVHQVGPNTPGWEVGDHVVLSFLPGCGRCRMCAAGQQNLCDRGARTMTGTREDGSPRFTIEGKPVGQMAGCATFANYSLVHVDTCVKISKDIPLERACLTGCGVGTGWGSAVNSAGIEVGDTVIVMGIGGIGINAVQGASHAGAMNIIAVDPVPFKREKAQEFGATHAVASIQEATELARSMTNGQGADSAIVTVGVTTGEHVGQAFSAIRKGGTVVVTGVGKFSEVGVPIALSELTLFQKRLQGSLFGASSPSKDIPRQLALYQAGKLKLDELVSRTYKLDEINQGYADMHAGINLRGIIVHEH